MKITPSSPKSPTGLFPIESIGRTEEFEAKTRCSRSNKERSQYRVYVADSSSKEEASPTGTPSIIQGTNSDNTDTGDNPPSLSDSVCSRHCKVVNMQSRGACGTPIRCILSEATE